MAVEKINPIISKTPEYFHWVDKLLTKSCGCEDRHETIEDDEAIEDHETIGEHVRFCLKPLKTEGRNEPWEWLIRHVLVTLFCANEYPHNNDWFAGNTAERLENLESQLKLIDPFARLIKKDPDFGARFFLHAFVPQNSPDEIFFSIPQLQDHAVSNHDAILKYDAVLKSAFKDYKDSLKKEIFTSNKYKRMKLVARGGLLYPEFNENGSKNKITNIKINSILFHLTYIFRHFTDQKFDLGPEARKMPPFGDPRYDLTAKILNKDSNNILKHIDRLEEKGVYICPWPPSL